MLYNCELGEVIEKDAIQRCFSNKFMQAIVRDILERNVFQEENEPISLEFQSLKMEMGNRMKSDYYGFLLYSLIFKVPIYLPDFAKQKWYEPLLQNPRAFFREKIRKMLSWPIRLFEKRDPNPAPGTVSLKKMGLKGGFHKSFAKMKKKVDFMYHVLEQNLSYTSVNAVHCYVGKDYLEIYLDENCEPFVEIPNEDDEEYDLDWAAQFGAMALAKKIDYFDICVFTDGECDMNEISGKVWDAWLRISELGPRKNHSERDILYSMDRRPVILGNTCLMRFEAFPREGLNFDN